VSESEPERRSRPSAVDILFPLVFSSLAGGVFFGVAGVAVGGALGAAIGGIVGSSDRL